MVKKELIQDYLKALLIGDRTQCRKVIEEALQTGTTANSVYINIVWPIMVEIEKLQKADRITSVTEHMAVRINRSIVDQLQNKLPRKQLKQKKIAICCAPEETQELGAQITADLFESDGWEVKFLGGGLNNEDIIAFVGEYGPNILLIYGTAPAQAPATRALIDHVRDINTWPDMKIMVSGGLFNRAEGLWEEIGADLFSPDAQQAVQIANNHDMEKLNERRSNNKQKKKRKSHYAKSTANDEE